MTIVVQSSGGSSLPRALASVLAQTHERFECIVVDRSYDSRANDQLPEDPRFRTIAMPGEASCGAAWNKGVDAGQGDLLVLIGEDDVLDPRRLEVAAAGIGPTGMHVCGARRHGVDGGHDLLPIAHGDRRSSILGAGSPAIQQVMLRRLDAAAFDPTLRLEEVAAWWFSMRDHAVFASTDEVLVTLPAPSPDLGRDVTRRFHSRSQILEIHADLLAHDRDARAFHRLRTAEAALATGRRRMALRLAIDSWRDRRSAEALAMVRRAIRSPKPLL